MGGRYPLKGRFPLKEIQKMFPDTAVSVLKECFEALRLYDFVEILEKVKPRSLHPTVSSEEIEKLRRADDRPIKYHSDVTVLIVNNTLGQEDIQVNAEKMGTFFKELKSRNEVTIISLASSQKSRQFVIELDVRHSGYYSLIKEKVESVLQQKARLQKELEKVMQIEKGLKQGRRLELERKLNEVKQDELGLRNTLESDAITDRDSERLKEPEKESTEALSTAVDELIHNQG